MPAESCTVVSTLPFQLSEDKFGLIPFRYIIPSCKKERASTLVVGEGYHLYLVPMTEGPPIKMIDSAERIAEGLCQDYIGANIAVSYEPKEDGAISAPGLFWVKGEYDVKGIIDKFPVKLAQAEKNTTAWFKSLIEMADDYWQKTHMHRSISDLQRAACRHLRLEREWNFDVVLSQVNLCWACKASIHPTAMICGSCKAILKPKEYEENKTRFVQQ